VADPQVKGIAFRGILSAAERLHGPEAAPKLMAQLPAELAKAFQYKAIVTSGWYPIGDYRTLLAATAKTFGGVPALRLIGRDASLQDFRGIYKVLTFVLSPQFVIKRSPGMFNRYYDTGTLEIPEARPGFCRARFTGCTGFDPLMWEDAVAGAAGVLEACGGKDVKTTVIEGGGTDDHVTVNATWT
jgi:hypothetical protein